MVPMTVSRQEKANILWRYGELLEPLLEMFPLAGETRIHQYDAFLSDHI